MKILDVVSGTGIVTKALFKLAKEKNLVGARASNIQKGYLRFFRSFLYDKRSKSEFYI